MDNSIWPLALSLILVKIRREIYGQQIRHNSMLHGQTTRRTSRQLGSHARFCSGQRRQESVLSWLKRFRSSIPRFGPSLRHGQTLPRRIARWATRRHAYRRTYSKLLQATRRELLGPRDGILGPRAPRRLNTSHSTSNRKSQSHTFRSQSRRRRRKSVLGAGSYSRSRLERRRKEDGDQCTAFG